jgi:hypothetical protein
MKHDLSIKELAEITNRHPETLRRLSRGGTYGSIQDRKNLEG